MKTIREHLEKVTPTTANATSARISAESVGEEAYAKWLAECKTAHFIFYRYQLELDSMRLLSAKDAEVSDELRTLAGNAIRSLLALIGEVNGYKIVCNPAMIESLTALAIKDRKSATGENARLTEQIRKLRKEIKEAPNGVRHEWIEEKEDRLGVLLEEVKEVRKRTESCTHKTTQQGEGKFISLLELELSKIVCKQSAMSFAELEAEEKIRKEARKKRNAQKRKAETEAKAQGTSVQDVADSSVKN